MNKRPFNKPALTCAEQVAQLQRRGMVIADPAQAEFYLGQLNYYRLGAYWLPFENNHEAHTFKPSTRFEDVLNLYVFDRELRLLMLDAIERIEVAVRAQWVYQLAHRHGTHAHLDATLAYRTDRWQKHLRKLREEVERSDETFIKHLIATYLEDLPPVWAVCEVMSLGSLSHWFHNLKPMPTRRAIAASFGVDDGVLQSWLHHLTFIRNLCAHHARLWNREFTITPQAPRSKPATLAGQFQPGSRRLYNTFALTLYMLDKVSPASTWRERLKALIAHHGINVAAMGFPTDWASRAIWQEGTP